MKHLFSLPLLCLFTLPLQAQDTLPEPNTIPLIAYWNLGDTFHYERIKGDITYKDDMVEDSSATTSYLDLIVVDSTDANYVIKVLLTGDLAPTLLKSGLKVTDMFKAAAASEFIDIEYVTDEMGAFQAVKNLDKAYKGYTLLMDTLAARNKKTVTSNEDLDLLFAKIKSKAYFEALFMLEIKILHRFYGNPFEQDSIWEFETEAVNPFNPTDTLSIPNTAIATIPEDWDGLIRLQNWMTIDGDLAKSYMSGLFDDTAISSKMEAEFDEKPLRMEYYISYAFYPDDGVLHSYYYSMISYRGDEKYKEKFIELRLKDE